MSSPASPPKEIHRSAEQGELQKVVKWLRKGGAVDKNLNALFAARDEHDATSQFTDTVKTALSITIGHGSGSCGVRVGSGRRRK